MENTAISVIILTKNQIELLEKILEASKNQKGCYASEIIILDNGSCNEALELSMAYKNCRVIKIPGNEFHHAKTRNIGAKSAKGDVLVYLNGDAIPTDDYWLSSLVENLTDPRVAAVYGRQIPVLGTNPINRFRTNWNYGKEKLIKLKGKLPELGIRTYYFSSVNCAIRKSVWKQFPFPEDVLVYEDAAFAKTVIDAGLKIAYAPKAKVFHAHNYSLIDILRKYFDSSATYKMLGIYQDSMAKLNSEGISFIKAGVNYLINKNRIHWFPYFIAFICMGYLGIVLGRYADKIPEPIRSRLSFYKR